jgi:hypothetical protein
MPSPYQLNTFPSHHFHQNGGHFAFPIITHKGNMASFRSVFRNIFARSEEVVEENNDHQQPQPPTPPQVSPLPLPPLQVPQAQLPPQLSPIIAESRLLGAPGGPEIDNKNTILGEIDEALGVRKPPAIEFIFVEPYLFLILLPTPPYLRSTTKGHITTPLFAPLFIFTPPPH